jgi:hypothetical protein
MADIAYSFPPGFADDAKNLAVDFDGVLHDDYKGFADGTCYGQPVDGAREALASLAAKYRIVVFTAKAKPSRPLVGGKTGVELIQEWLTKHGMQDFVAEVTSEKPRACLYIDDKAHRFTSWSSTLAAIEDLT